MKASFTTPRMVVSVATLNMMIKIALVVFISGFSTGAEAGLQQSHKQPANNAQQEQPDGIFAIGFDFNLLSPRSSISPSSRRLR